MYTLFELVLSSFQLAISTKMYTLDLHKLLIKIIIKWHIINNMSIRLRTKFPLINKHKPIDKKGFITSITIAKELLPDKPFIMHKIIIPSFRLIIRLKINLIEKPLNIDRSNILKLNKTT